MIELKGKYTSAKIFAETVEQGVVSQVYELLNHPMFKDEKIRIMADCLSEDTEVLTEKGFIKITELQKSDKVGNYDVNTKKIFFEKPKDIIIREKRDGERIFSLYSKILNTDITTSENHRNAYAREMGKTTKELSDITYHKDFLWGGIGSRNVEEEYDDATLLLLMWIVGDGSIKKTHNERNTNYRISFGLKKERKIKRVLELLDTLNLVYNHSISTKQSEIVINTKSSKGLINIVGVEKKLPNLLKLTKRQAILVKDELIKIDGNYENYLKQGSYVLNTCKEKESNMYASFLALNFGSTKTSHRIMKSFDKTKPLSNYTISLITNEGFLQNRNGLPNSKLVKKEVSYNKKLVCITCDSGFFIARQNGRSFVTGNCHQGKGCVIGLTSTNNNKIIIPNIIGVDIGCSMLSLNLGKIDIDFESLDNFIKNNIPNGFGIHNQKYNKYELKNDFLQEIERISKITKSDYNRHLCSLGSLGGGNHFLEVSIDKDNNKWLIIHTGSRNFGLQVAKYHQKIAENYCKKKVKDITLWKNQNIGKWKQGKIKLGSTNGTSEDWINQMQEQVNKYKVQKELCFLEENLADNYIKDMKIAQEFAYHNRQIIAKILINYLNVIPIHIFETVHNYYDGEIIRKGAVSAKKGEMLLIPINMRDGSILAIGKGNEDYNNSAPHGAGRLMSRSKAKENIDFEDFKNTMKDIYTTSVCESTLDEAPQSYKPIEEILNNVGDTIEVIDILKPIYNFKAH